MTTTQPIKPGDTVTIRAKVVRVVPENLLVEVFSKTDQYEAWVRPDLVVEHTPAPAVPDEPPPGAYHLVRRPDETATLIVRVRGCDNWISDAPVDDEGSPFWDWEPLWNDHGGPDVRIVPLVAERDALLRAADDADRCRDCGELHEYRRLSETRRTWGSTKDGHALRRTADGVGEWLRKRAADQAEASAT